jgi:GH25 family lysozyme M1 (1,4-beta-N-acetylmuramidase)
MSRQPQGIDTFSGKGNPNWSEIVRANNLADDGQRFTILKASEGATFKAKDWFQANRQAALGTGHLVGAYHFARPSNNNWDAEVRNFLDCITTDSRGNKYALPDLLVLDFEDANFHGNGATWAWQWLQCVEYLTGKVPALYTYGGYWQDHGSSDPKFLHYPLWLAAYQANRPTGPAPWGNAYDLWQFTSTAQITGHNGNTDVNLYTGPDIRRFFNPPKPTQKVAPVFAPALSNIVDALNAPYGGCWLLGADGAIYTTGNAPYFGGMNTDLNKQDFAGRTAARLAPFQGGYQIVATSGEIYVPKH